MSSFRETWRGHEKRALVTLLGLILAFFLFFRFAMWVETREGVVLEDPILSLLPVIELNWPIFIALYGSLLIALAGLIRNPDAMLRLLSAYTLLLSIRIVVMYIAPFSSPEGMIVLIDPIAVMGTEKALENDLFFSGHTATIFLLFLTATRPLLRYIFLGMTAVMGMMLLLQHVHYAVDVMAAPFFAYGCYRVAFLLRRIRSDYRNR